MKQTLSQWIEEALTDGDKITEDGKVKPCTGLVLHHFQSNGLEKEVHGVRLGARAYNAQDLGKLFEHKAQSFSQELPGVQQFVLYAFYGDDREPTARHPFKVRGETLASEGLMTEGPDERGRTQQSMRLTEAIVQGSFRKDMHVFDTLVRSLEITSMDANTMRKDMLSMFQGMKELMIENLKLQYDRGKELQNRQLLGQLVGLAPALVNSIAGKDVFPQSSVDTNLVEMLAKSLNPESAQALMRMLPPNVVAPLMGRIEEVLQQEVLKEKARAALNGKNPEDDAAGD